VTGNNFRTRIYPFFAQGTRTVTIGYDEELTLEKGMLRYRLPMAYTNPIENFSVTATVWKCGLEPVVPKSDDGLRFDRAGENYVASFARENYRPAGALNFALPAPVDIPRVIMQSAQGSRYFLASVTPKLKTRKKAWDSELAIIWDVSMSGSQRNLKRELEALDIVFAEKKNARVHLYFLNNRLTGMNGENDADGAHIVSDGNWDGLRKSLKNAVFDGGTDFSQIKLNNIAGNEILFFSDGISTLGDPDFLRSNNTNRPIHCVVSSAKADYGSMKFIAGKTLGKFVNINALSSERLKNEMLSETQQFLGTEHGKSISEVYPGVTTPVYGDFSVAGISDTNAADITLLFGFGGKVEKRITVKLDAKNADSLGNARKIWAQKKIEELDLNYEKNRAELTELGRQFGIVTRNTSLIVLETAKDYVRYNIMPPITERYLYAEYHRLLYLKKQETLQRDMVNKAVGDTGATASDGNKDTRDSGGGKGTRVTGFRAFFRKLENYLFTIFYPEVPTVFHEALPDEERIMKSVEAEVVYATHENDRSEDSEEDFDNPAVTLKPIKKDNDYLKKLTGKTAEDYRLYLKIRKDYAWSPAFYFDMADWFHKRCDKKTALRVLTSIAELELEDASLYRLLGYRFKEYGEYALEKFVCEKVIQWRPMEPQSYRDYALALADNGETQAALDSLCGLLTKTYSENIADRSRGIDEIVVMEINRLIAKNANLNTSKIDKAMIANIPVDIRVVINWNINDADIDLYVIDPDGEECCYDHGETKIGGRISAYNADGYGPEQFILKKAPKGKYRVLVNYLDGRRVTSAVPSTVMVEIYTKYAGKGEKRKIVCLQMSNAKQEEDGKVEVAEFEF
jgi:hypothetical protein